MIDTRTGPYLIFDFDGVIANSWETLIEAHLQIGTCRTRAEAIEEMDEYFSKKPRHVRNHSLTDEEMALEYKWSADFGQKMFEIGVPLFNEFVQEIEKIPTKHKAIVSSGSQRYVLPAVQKTNINPTHILAFEDHHSKEEKIELIATDWHIPLSEVYYVTDTLADVYELRDILSRDRLIGVAWGFSGYKLLTKELLPQYILEEPKDIRRLFTN